ncbi:hypothetical protein D0911_03090 [Zhongshania marina]|uniref:Uncharacterized protein n=1 Tax=Zhongshania marina TaxID=2304603 RepID=A0ABX9W8V3_9GAMM|nr:hypothetical protein D0911_03090 [Zhongshania marina]
MELRTAPYLWPINYVQYLGPSQSRSEPAPTPIFVGGRAEADRITRKTFALAHRGQSPLLHRWYGFVGGRAEADRITLPASSEADRITCNILARANRGRRPLLHVVRWFL